MHDMENTFLSTYDFSKTAIIQPPPKNNDKYSNTRTKYVLIDSRDRDYNIYPNSNSFTIKLDEHIRDVVEIELISAHIPSTTYNINDNNCAIYNKITPTVPTDNLLSTETKLQGHWSYTDSDISALLNVIGPEITGVTKSETTESVTNSGDNYLKFGNATNFIKYTKRTKKITIKFLNNLFFVDNDGNYLSKSMGELLGFKRNIMTTAGGDDGVEAERELNLNLNDYILLHLPNFERFESRVSTNNIAQRAYAKLHLGGGNTRNVFFGRIKAFTNALTLNPTLQKLDRFEINFTDYYGNSYDFNNAELSLTFAVTYKSQPGNFDF